jgi:hypothetical protein
MGIGLISRLLRELSRRRIAANVRASAGDSLATDLVLRNPEFHFVMTRTSAIKIAAGRERFTIWSIAAEGLLESALEDTVIVVGGTGKKLKADLAQAYELRTQGLLA